MGSLDSSVDSLFTSSSVGTSSGFSASADGEGGGLGILSSPVSDGVLISC